MSASSVVDACWRGAYGASSGGISLGARMLREGRLPWMRIDGRPPWMLVVLLGCSSMVILLGCSSGDGGGGRRDEYVAPGNSRQFPSTHSRLPGTTSGWYCHSFPCRSRHVLD